MEAERYGIEELADLGGVTRRTVRYYVQEGLLPAPLGVGRGKHYGREHLERLLFVKALQQKGLTLDEVRREVGRRGRTAIAWPSSKLPLLSSTKAWDSPAPDSAPPARAAEPPPTPAGLSGEPSPSAWTRVSLLPGLEMHLDGRYRTPSRATLQELAEWCRRHLTLKQETNGDVH